MLEEVLSTLGQGTFWLGGVAGFFLGAYVMWKQNQNERP